LLPRRESELASAFDDGRREARLRLAGWLSPLRGARGPETFTQLRPSDATPAKWPLLTALSAPPCSYPKIRGVT